MSKKSEEKTQGARLNQDTLLFTNVTVSLETRIGRTDAKPVTSEQLHAMNQMFSSNGGATICLDGLLVLRQFTDRVLGEGATQAVLDELTNLHEPDSPLLFADYEEESNCKTHKVRALNKHPSIQKARNMAAMWTMQDHPLIAQTGDVVHPFVQERSVHWAMCLRTCQLPWKDDNVELTAGDVYVRAAA
jgi:hypothetical protein